MQDPLKRGGNGMKHRDTTAFLLSSQANLIFLWTKLTSCDPQKELLSSDYSYSSLQKVRLDHHPLLCKRSCKATVRTFGDNAKSLVSCQWGLELWLGLAARLPF